MKALVENKRGGNDYKSVLEILNIYQAVGDMHFIGERDYFNKIAEKLKKELGTDNKEDTMPKLILRCNTSKTPRPHTLLITSITSAPVRAWRR